MERFDVVCPDTEAILSIKKKVKDNGYMDEVLLSNLDFAEQVFGQSLLNKNVNLLVKGQSQYVRIGLYEDVVYTVSSKDGQAQIDCAVYCNNDNILQENVKSLHFSVHSCQDESKSCFEQAQKAVKSKIHALKITCNRFSITYTSTSTWLSAYEQKSISINTKCKFRFDQITAKGLLERKCWLGKEKPKCSELKKCLDFLIEKYLTMPESPKLNCKFILQGDQEMLEISSTCSDNKIQKEYILIIDSCSKVSMFPPAW